MGNGDGACCWTNVADWGFADEEIIGGTGICDRMVRWDEFFDGYAVCELDGRWLGCRSVVCDYGDVIIVDWRLLVGMEAILWLVGLVYYFLGGDQ